MLLKLAIRKSKLGRFNSQPLLFWKEGPYGINRALRSVFETLINPLHPLGPPKYSSIGIRIGYSLFLLSHCFHFVFLRGLYIRQGSSVWVLILNFQGDGSVCEHLSFGRESARLEHSFAQCVSLVTEGTGFYGRLFLGVRSSYKIPWHLVGTCGEWLVGCKLPWYLVLVKEGCCYL